MPTKVAADKDGMRDIPRPQQREDVCARHRRRWPRRVVDRRAPTWSSTEIERIRANSYGYARTLTLLEVQEDRRHGGRGRRRGRPEAPTVFACYAPHAVFKLHDIVRLTEPPYDPAKWKVVLPGEDPNWLSKSSAAVGLGRSPLSYRLCDFAAPEHPDVVRFLDRIDFKPEEAIDMSYALQVERQDPLAFAEQWVAKNQARVDGWAKP